MLLRAAPLTIVSILSWHGIAAAQMTWQLQSGPCPLAGVSTCATFDTLRGEGVLFGGRFSVSSHSPAYGETWVWNGQWQQRTPVHTPSPRYGHCMAFDRQRNVVVMALGGTANSVYFTDTWTWNGLDWTQASPATVPSARMGAVMVFDEARSTCMMFGGPIADTWTWDGTDWTLLAPAAAPAARTGQGMAYDVGRQKTVLYGGNDGGVIFDDVWEWDGTNWQQRPSSPAGARAGHAMFYDRSRGRTVVNGGDLGWGPLSDTWEFDGTQWTQVSIPSPPAGRKTTGHFYDSWRGTGVMVDGNTASGAVTETWVYAAISPASVVAYSAGCPGPAGVPAVSVVRRPILGDTYEIAVANLAPQSLTFMMIGWGMQSVEIGAVTPWGSGCILRVTLDSQVLLSGTSVYTIGIPNDPIFLGVALHDQAIQLEINAPSLESVSVSGAVRMVIGNP